MFKTFGKILFGTVNDRLIKKLKGKIDEINSLEESIKKYTDLELNSQTEKFKKRLQAGETLDDILPEAFAVVREAARRVLGERHYDVQLIGGIVLHQGKISEMHTGEGKTLVSTLPVYLNALTGRGVHVVTVNDYLAKRDSEWMSRIYNFLGLTVGCIVHGLSDSERKAAYNCDITYGTNNEFGFDFLRDNMKFDLDAMVQRKFNFAIIDEVDSILIDEARTPLIISGPTEENTDLYSKIDAIIPKLIQEDYEIDEKSRSVTLTEVGNTHVEQLLINVGLLSTEGNLYDIEHVSLVHHVNQALRAHKLFTKDTDYMIKDNQLLIIDEFTGRAMEGRRYSEGLHQALEAKENLPIQNENQTLASITFQNYFRMYPKLAGMSGSAMTEAEELSDIYRLEVITIPTNIPIKRIDEDDEIYSTVEEKYNAILKDIIEAHKKQQPVLVGTVSIEKSEYLSKLLKKNKIKHNVLNAKYHEQEAYIIAQAGIPGAITIATNMAGRGTDIKLGGNLDLMLSSVPENLDKTKKEEKIKEIKEQVERDKKIVLEAGGLYVIGTERHESRRIDNQLRGRSGRQGDPGRSKFFLSLEDDLMRIFASEKIQGLLKRLGLKDGEAIHHPMISRALERAQQKVEARNYDIRKNLLKFDDVSNNQRKIIYEQRKEIMESEDISETIEHIYSEVTADVIARHIAPNSYPEHWDIDGLQKEAYRIFNMHIPFQDWSQEEGITEEKMTEKFLASVRAIFKKKEEEYGAEIMRVAERRFYLVIIDQLWKDHLLSLDHLRQGISLRAYAQKDPLVEYKREAFAAFNHMLSQFQEMLTERLSHMQLHLYETENGPILTDQFIPQQQMHETRHDPALANKQYDNERMPKVSYINNLDPELRDKADPSTWGKVARNELCPCGSSKKYKQCHGKI